MFFFHLFFSSLSLKNSFVRSVRSLLCFFLLPGHCSSGIIKYFVQCFVFFMMFQMLNDVSNDVWCQSMHCSFAVCFHTGHDLNCFNSTAIEFADKHYVVRAFHSVK